MASSPPRKRRVSLAAAGDAKADGSSASSPQRGRFAAAIPHRPPLATFALALRIISIIASCGIFITVNLVHSGKDEDSAYASWSLAFPLGVMACAWSTADIAVLLIQHGGISERTRQRQRKHPPSRASAFSWGPAALHVAAHLAIWASGIFMSALLWMSWLINIRVLAVYDPSVEIWVGDELIVNTPPDEATLAKIWLLPALESILIVVHFTLFVLACVATDDKARRGMLVFVASDKLEKESVETLPASLWDVFYPTKLPLAVSVNQHLVFDSGGRTVLLSGVV